MKISRADFIKSAGISILGTAMPLSGAYASSNAINIEEPSFQFGISSGILKKFTLEKAARISLKMGIYNMILCESHLSKNLARKDIQKIIDNLKNQSITPYAVGELVLNTKDDVKKAFEYAQAAGVKLIVASPDLKLLPDIEKAVKKFSVIKIAIHNHGPEDARFPTPGSAFDIIQNMDDKIGLCIDIGHTIRAGQDPAKKIIKYADRVFDVHLKDENNSTKEATNIEIGRGVANYPEIMRALKKIKYDKVACFEIEKDEEDPIGAISESIGYVKGVWSGINS
ncbi:MAG: sugar phosphate isomerase/epimerase family protein [Cytophagales bacterium]